TLEFEHVPNLYILYSTKDLKAILNQEEMDKYIIGYPALNRHIKIVPTKSDNEKTKWFNELVKLKEASGLYSIPSQRITAIPKGNMKRYSIKIDWPYQAPPGRYIATVYEVRGGKIVDMSETSISVKQSGFVKAIADVASKNGALYGIISIVIALAVGFGISFIFKKS
ncbi:MAG TPA: TIGR02186 family protein, partial [Anaerolineae bacterium]|nr:TIGR02186 family protein [Anaerolineae bacterium]